MQVASSAYFYAKADESRTHIGFDGQIFAHAALKLLTIRQYSLQALPCLSENLLRQNCEHLSAVLFEIFSAFFGAGGLAPIKTKKEKIAERAHRQAIEVRLLSAYVLLCQPA